MRYILDSSWDNLCRIWKYHCFSFPNSKFVWRKLVKAGKIKANKKDKMICGHVKAESCPIQKMENSSDDFTLLPNLMPSSRWQRVGSSKRTRKMKTRTSNTMLGQKINFPWQGTWWWWCWWWKREWWRYEGRPKNNKWIDPKKMDWLENFYS